LEVYYNVVLLVSTGAYSLLASIAKFSVSIGLSGFEFNHTAEKEHNDINSNPESPIETENLAIEASKE
jgi:hypothetical protein